MQSLLSLIYDSSADTKDLFSSIIYLAAGMIGAFSLIAIIRKYIDKKSFLSMGFNFKDRLFDLLLGLGLGTLLISTGFFILIIFGNLEVDSFNFDAKWFFGYLLLMVLVSIHEEVLLRGYLLNSFMSIGNKYISLFFSSIVFAALHLMNPNMGFVPFLNIFLAGILLGISYIHSKNLWFPMSLHFSWNFVQGPMLGFEVSGQEVHSLVIQHIIGSELFTGGKFGFEGSLLATFLISISIIALEWFFKRNEALKQKITIGFSDNQLTIESTN